MTNIPTNEEIVALLDQLDGHVADDLESDVLDFKPWLPNVKDNMTVALEMAVCLANHAGGVVVFGVRDRRWFRRRCDAAEHPAARGRHAQSSARRDVPETGARGDSGHGATEDIHAHAFVREAHPGI